jgi:hypothetical protein
MKIFAALFLAGCLAGCHHSIHTQISINAPEEKIWNILMDTTAYSQWNSFLAVEGSFAKDAVIGVVVSPPEDKSIHFEPTVLKLSSDELIWRGRLIMPGLFTGEHRFSMVKQPDGQVVLHQDEEFSGILVPFVNLDNTRRGFEKMNAELKARAES